MPKLSESDIIVLGDSFSYGRGVRFTDIFTSRLQAKIKQTGRPVSIFNASNVGANIWAINRIYDELRTGPTKTVIYSFVLNDFDLVVSYDDIGYRDFIDMNGPDPSKDMFWTQFSIGVLIDQIIKKRNLNTKVVQAYLDSFEDQNWRSHIEVLNELKQKVREDNRRLVLMIWPLFYRLRDYPFTKIHTKLMDYCSKSKMLCLDLLNQFKNRDESSFWANPTDQHPNHMAHQEAAAVLFDFLKRQDLLPK